MTVLIWSPLVIALIWVIWDWGRMRYLDGRSDTLDELIGVLIEHPDDYMDRLDFASKLLQMWGDMIPAYTDSKVYPVPKHKRR